LDKLTTHVSLIDVLLNPIEKTSKKPECVGEAQWHGYPSANPRYQYSALQGFDKLQIGIFYGLPSKLSRF
jgi:hypothetical protein